MLFICSSCFASDKPIHVLFGLPVGSTHNLIFNTITESVSDKKLTFISESKIGLSGSLAHQYVANSSPDGKTLGMVSSSIVMNPLFFPDVAFDSIRDFERIIYLGSQDNALITRNLINLKNVKDTIEYTKINRLSYGHNGQGTQSYACMEDLFKGKLLGIPYKGTNFLMVDLIGNRIDVALLPIGAILQYANSGKINVIATTGNKRFELLKVPTIGETVPVTKDSVWNRAIWYAIVAPKGLNPDMKTYLHNYFKSGITLESKRKMFDSGINLEMKDVDDAFMEEHTLWKRYLGR
jgi:tripartite-type tricarboxylate transporter receptor subunit TctC